MVVGGGLDVGVELVGAGVGEGQLLAQVGAGDLIVHVDPEIGIGDSGPHEPAGGAARGQWLLVDLECQSPGLLNSWEELGVVGELGHGRRQGDHPQVADVVHRHLVDRLGAKHLDAVAAAPAQDHLQEAAVVLDRAVETTAA